MKTYVSTMNMAALVAAGMAHSASAATPEVAGAPEQPARLFPLPDVRLLESPFTRAVEANHHYLLAHDADRLLVPFRRKAGLATTAQPYGNGESDGLDGHTAGHYLSALSLMIASGEDPDGEFRRRLDYMVGELAEVPTATEIWTPSNATDSPPAEASAFHVHRPLNQGS